MGVEFTNRILTVGELLNLQMIQQGGHMNLPAVVSLLASRSSLSMDEVLAMSVIEMQEMLTPLLTSLTEALKLQRIAGSFLEKPKL